MPLGTILSHSFKLSLEEDVVMATPESKPLTEHVSMYDYM